MLRELRKKRILFVVQMPPPTTGASMMSKSIVESDLINATFECDVVGLYYAKNVRDLGSLSIMKVVRLGGYFVKVIGKLMVNRPDLIYFNLTLIGNTLYRDLVFVILFKIFKIKTVYHLHTKGFVDKYQNNAFRKQIYKFVFKGESVISLSNGLAKELDGLADDVHVVNNGIHTIVLPDKLKATQQPPVRILVISNLIKTKGILIFLEVLKLLHSRKIDFHAHIVGNEADITFTEVTAFIKNNNLEHKLFLIGPRYGDEKFTELREADVFVFPTLNDAFPLVLLEAMQSELPIISTYEGAIPEIVEDGKTGFLVNPSNIEALAEKIETLITNESLRMSMGKLARERFLKKYTFSEFERNMNNVFQKIIK